MNLIITRIDSDNRQIDYDAERIFVRRDLDNSLWEISFNHGKVPRVLEGKWTSVATATEAITNYLEGRDKKKVA